ncbi:TPA: sugar transferase [Candidatus Poribacteria bacterium]|nr:sugar transferase [Candidatus Poribacteria bacterium]
MAKRVTDLLMASLGLLTLWPLMLICALLVKINSPGPALYRARRIGLEGREFTMYKFRSMVQEASKLGGGITSYGDPRVTRFGRILRRFKLDELPQLFNVLKGDMSFVGPRPEDPRYVALYTPQQRRVLSVRPGITGISQIINRNEEEKLKGQPDPEEYYVKVLMPEKIKTDINYIEKRNLRMDFKLILKTVIGYSEIERLRRST